MTRGSRSTGGASPSRRGSRCVQPRPPTACEQALAHLERSRGPRLAMPVRARLLSVVYGSGRRPSARRSSGWRRSVAASTARSREAWSRSRLGTLLAMKGEIERARELVRGGRQAYLDAGAAHDRRRNEHGRGGGRAPGGRQSRPRTSPARGPRAARADRRARATTRRPLCSCASVSTSRSATTRSSSCVTTAREATGADDLINFV